MNRILGIVRLLVFYFASIPFLFAGGLPNIVWIISEDNAPEFMSLYNSSGVEMPNLEQLAKEGIIFDDASSNAPVCSVSKSSYWTSQYATELSAHNHRAMMKNQLPETVKMLPEYLREYGYYCTKNGKDDVNFLVREGTWDAVSFNASWRDRKDPEQPFFYVRNLWTTHESRLHENSESSILSNTVQSCEIPPYLRDSEISRKTISYYKEKHKILDKEIGSIIEQLKLDGLYEDSIIVYFSDHGGALPRTKGTFYYSGLRVPLIIKVPQRFSHKFFVKAGSRIKAPVSLMDLVPTFLDILTDTVPEHMEGIPLNKVNDKKNLHRALFASSDRFDETYTFSRSVRVGDFRYVRNYLPFQSAIPYNAYRRKAPLFKSWYSDYEKGFLDENQSTAFKEQASEALYNIKTDPFELNNLINEYAKKSIASELRICLSNKIKASQDFGFIPEVAFAELVNSHSDLINTFNSSIKQAIRINDLALMPFYQVVKELSEILKSDSWIERYWGLVVCSSFGRDASFLKNEIQLIYDKDDNNMVRFRAAEYLSLIGVKEYQGELLKVLSEATNDTESLLILNGIINLMELHFCDFNKVSVLSSIPQHSKQNHLIQNAIEYFLEYGNI